MSGNDGSTSIEGIGGSENDWWGAALRTFLEAPEPVPFDFCERPVQHCSPEGRRHEAATLADGVRFWSGMASLLGLSRLERVMADICESCQGQPVSTPMLEALLLARSGDPSVVDAFHRFVYGLADPSPAPELWLRDAVEDGGADYWAGAFWDSPDLWVRHHDDGGTSHQTPSRDADNWLHARIRNKASAGHGDHFVVAFQSRGFAGTQFTFPADFLPCTAATAEFALTPGETRVIKARWPRALVPPPSAHSCLLAAVISRADHPIAGRHAWEHNNLVQKNLSLVALSPGQSASIPVVLGNWLPGGDTRFELEAVIPHGASLDVSLVHPSGELFRNAELPASALDDAAPRGRRVAFSKIAKVPIALAPFSQSRVAFELRAPADSKPANPFKVHLVQRNPRTQHIVGGIAVEVTIRR